MRTLPPEMPCYPLPPASAQLTQAMPPFWIHPLVLLMEWTTPSRKRKRPGSDGRQTPTSVRTRCPLFTLPCLLLTQDVLRTSPCFLSTELELFDQLQRTLHVGVHSQHRQTIQPGPKLLSQYGQAALVSGVSPSCHLLPF